MMEMQPTLKEAALEYVARDWAVLPLHFITGGKCSCGKPDCSSPGKHPLTIHGLSDASKDPVQIEAWWEEWPAANIGVATGAMSNLVVVDVDSAEALESARQLLGDPFAYLSVQTGGGGYHFYFLHPGDAIRNSASKIARHLDIRGDGGYVLAPPSNHESGSQYVWLSEVEPVLLPAAVCEAAKKSEGVTVALGAECLAPIHEGGRNSTLASLGGAMRSKGFSPQAIEDALLMENQLRCLPPLEEREVLAVVRSISRYPGSLPAVADRMPVFRPHTVEEILSMTPEVHEWVFEDYLAKGVFTILTSQPKIGKTTFSLSVVKSVISAEEFLGRQTCTCPVLYLTEENLVTLRDVIVRVGLDDVESGGSLAIVPRAPTYGMTWDEIVEQAHSYLNDMGKGLLVVDTFPDWVGLCGDWENSSGTAKEMMRPLRMIADDGNAVLALFHERKSGGNVQNATRGSSAFAGDADLLLNLVETPGVGSEDRRTLKAEGRITSTPKRLAIEFDGRTFSSLGEEATFARSRAEQTILQTLGHSEDEALLFPDVQILIGQSEGTTRRALESLEQTGRVVSKSAYTKNKRLSKAYWLCFDKPSSSPE